MYDSRAHFFLFISTREEERDWNLFILTTSLKRSYMYASIFHVKYIYIVRDFKLNKIKGDYIT